MSDFRVHDIELHDCSIRQNADKLHRYFKCEFKRRPGASTKKSFLTILHIFCVTEYRNILKTKYVWALLQVLFSQTDATGSYFQVKHWAYFPNDDKMCFWPLRWQLEAEKSFGKRKLQFFSLLLVVSNCFRHLVLKKRGLTVQFSGSFDIWYFCRFWAALFEFSLCYLVLEKWRSKTVFRPYLLFGSFYHINITFIIFFVK